MCALWSASTRQALSMQPSMLGLALQAVSVARPRCKQQQAETASCAHPSGWQPSMEQGTDSPLAPAQAISAMRGIFPVRTLRTRLWTAGCMAQIAINFVSCTACWTRHPAALPVALLQAPCGSSRPRHRAIHGMFVQGRNPPPAAPSSVYACSMARSGGQALRLWNAHSLPTLCGACRLCTSRCTPSRPPSSRSQPCCAASCKGRALTPRCGGPPVRTLQALRRRCCQAWPLGSC